LGIFKGGFEVINPEVLPSWAEQGTQFPRNFPVL